MPLGMEVGLASTQAMLCSIGTQLPREKRHTHSSPIFGPCLLWPNGWMDEDANCYGSRPRHRPRGPSCPRKGHSSPLAPSFRSCLLCKKTNQKELLLSVITSNKGNRYKQLSLHSNCIATRTNTSHIAQCGNAFSIKNTFKVIEYFFSRNVFRLWL